MRLDVYLNDYGNRRLVGRLDDRGGEIVFQYAPDFLQEELNLSPFLLPLRTQVFIEDSHVFGGLYGLFEDSIPDGWGRLLLDRTLKNILPVDHPVGQLERLALVGATGIGALEYEPFLEEREGPEPAIADSTLLDTFAHNAIDYLQGESTEILDELYMNNGSSGGARPKVVALVSDDRKDIVFDQARCVTASLGYAPWLIKFPNSHDQNSIGKIEYMYSCVAKKAGIEMPPTHLFPSNHGPGYFGIQRFDRYVEPETRRILKIHVHSACGLLHASHRYSSIDYESLIRLTSLLTQDVRETERMVRLMMFNVKSGNKDDHSRNFSFVLRQDGTWKLSPAYDLTPSNGFNGEHSATVNNKGTDIRDKDLLQVATSGGLSPAKAKEILQEVSVAVAEVLTGNF